MIDFLNEYILLPILPIFVVVCGAYFTVSLKLYSPRRIFGLIHSLFKNRSKGGISPFSALTVALAGTLGVGNITGVAVALTLGGAGAVFWMWISAIFSCGLKYSEVALSVKHRHINSDGYVGGPMYYIRSPKISKLFCILCLICSLISGPSIQINSAACILYDSYGVPHLITGAVIAVITCLTVLGGMRSVSALSEKLIPAVTVIFMLLSCTVIFSHLDMMPSVLDNIFKSAFDFSSLTAGLGGAGIASAIKHGMAKGVLSHEAGSGTSTMSHASATAATPRSQGTLGILEVTVDTLIMCSATAFVLLLSGVQGSMDGTKTVCDAYSLFFPVIGKHFISLSTVFFAFATVLCWAYYGTVCIGYLSESKKIKRLYIVTYSLFTIFGAISSPSLAWQLTDLFTCILTFLNTGCLIAMRDEIHSLS